MPDRPPWLARKKEKLRRFFFRRLILPALNRQLRRRGLKLYRYAEGVDRLWGMEELVWEALTAEPVTADDRWYGPLAERDLRGGTVFDVGGGGGAISTWFSRWADRVIVFEPSPTNRESIRIHHRIRSVENAEVVASAVGDACGEATLYLKKGSGHHALDEVGASPTVDRITVPITTLDAFAEAHGVDRVRLLKIDVEGYEPEVLRGADRLLRERRVELVLFEYSPEFYTRRGIDPLAPLHELERRGYAATHLDGSSVDPDALASGRQTDLFAEPRATNPDRA